MAYELLHPLVVALEACLIEEVLVFSTSNIQSPSSLGFLSVMSCKGDTFKTRGCSVCQNLCALHQPAEGSIKLP